MAAGVGRWGQILGCFDKCHRASAVSQWTAGSSSSPEMCKIAGRRSSRSASRRSLVEFGFCRGRSHTPPSVQVGTTYATLVAIRAVPVFLFRRLTQCLRSNSESVVLGDLAHATRHSGSIQRRRRSPTNTLSHNMHILRSVGVPTKPDQLHFHYFTPIRSWFLRHAIPFVLSISALESASRLEWFEVEWSVSRWMRSTLFLVRCESLGTSSDGCRPSWCSRSVRRRQDSEFFSHGGGRRWLVCWRY